MKLYEFEFINHNDKSGYIFLVASHEKEAEDMARDALNTRDVLFKSIKLIIKFFEVAEEVKSGVYEVIYPSIE